MAHFLRGYTYLRLGDEDKAFADFNAAIEQDPKTAAYYLDRGILYVRRGDCASAVNDFDKAVGLGNANLRGLAYGDKAWELATCPDAGFRNGRLAVDMAQQALKLDNGPDGHDTLAAALAEAGQFQEAVAEETRALAKAGPKQSQDIIAGYQERLGLYMRGVPLSRASAMAPRTWRFVVEG
jgi:tetratricopeptide (TPR) repeat protein